MPTNIFFFINKNKCDLSFNGLPVTLKEIELAHKCLSDFMKDSPEEAIKQYNNQLYRTNMNDHMNSSGPKMLKEWMIDNIYEI